MQLRDSFSSGIMKGEGQTRYSDRRWTTWSFSGHNQLVQQWQTTFHPFPRKGAEFDEGR